MRQNAPSAKDGVTIAEIARALGISRGTVDRAIHQRKGVKDEVRAKVLAKAEELGYKPNRAARMLAACKAPKLIGVLLPSIGNPFFDSLIQGIEKAKEDYADQGISVVIKEVEGYDENVHLEGIRSLIALHVDALVLATLDTPKISECLEQTELPFAAVNSDLSSKKKLFYAGPDYTKKGMLHANLLSMMGMDGKNILILKGSNSFKGHDNLVEGFVSELAEGWAYEIVETGDNDRKAEEVVRRRISESTKVDVLFISTAGAQGAIKGLSGKRMLAFANDDTEEVKALVENGNIAWTVTQEPYRQGYESITRMQDYFITGDKPEDLITRNIIKIKQNIREE